MSQQISLTVNKKIHSVDVEPDMPLLYVLRNELQLTGTKFGCGLGQCGACTVLVGGNPVRACLFPVSAVMGQAITTIEGLGTGEAPHPLQTSFIEGQAVQCGYCISGMLMTAKALLDQNPNPSEAEIRTALNGNLCRCGTHLRIMRAIKQAAATATEEVG